MKDCKKNPAPKVTAKTENAEHLNGREALSDADLALVNAAGEGCVPTMNPEVLLGRHDIPMEDEESRRSMPLVRNE